MVACLIVSMKLLSLSVWPGLLLAGVSYAAPTSSALDNGNASVSGSVDNALVARAVLEKREVFFGCSDTNFSPYLSQAIEDGRTIISNAVDHLELAISLYDEDGSGRLKQTKDEKSKRTFDEHNAWATYSQFVSKLRWSSKTEDGLAKSKTALKKIKGTRDFAKSLVKQYDNYMAGRSVPWIRGGIPYIRIYCNEEAYLSVRDSNGLTYTESHPDYQDWFEHQGSIYYMLLQTEGTELTGKEVWVPRRDVCPLNQGPTQTRFGQVPARKGIKAYVSHPRDGLVEETMTFCPAEFDQWISVDQDRIARGIHYRDLHVKIGGSPSEHQKGAISTLLADPDITADQGFSRGMMWLGRFLTATMIHESTHSEAFAGGLKTLIDVKCDDGDVATSPNCMDAIAKGEQGKDADGNPQGDRDAETFAAYTMGSNLRKEEPRRTVP
ncbi:hypothetical protein P168DRAFT_283563 [Aspergillus campestris IBT 28561]|uniref:Uncharacterized protein n=1 Tax=Aspergillus campestris (strain IBT 28561) TaxID=1392248 RepID=A0A2I1CYY5_ASPC2|nr:uncharacterized protein P168DRAFT_283563 [Aspergillus campestris IBT 28561]PKY02820.1 hypothetical protein P168DRAFT_283563 [Aspergillus campestris IBT 28561]